MKLAIATLLVLGTFNFAAAQSGCKVDTLYSWNFETEPSDWSGSGWGWCHQDSMVGPATAHSPVRCRGTVCDGNYAAYTTYVMTTPPMIVPEVPAGGYINLCYYGWWKLIMAEAKAVVRVNVSGQSSDTVLGPFSGENAAWALDCMNITQYGGKSIQVDFILKVGNIADPYLHEGWYIDDVSLLRFSIGVNAGRDDTIYVGDSVQLVADCGCGVPSYSYLWTPATGLSNATIRNPIAHPTTTTTYVVTVTDSDTPSKMATDTVTVNVTDVPTPVLVSCDSTNRVGLRWHAVTPATGYIVYRNGDSIAYTTDTVYAGPFSGSAETYQVVALNGVGRSALSDACILDDVPESGETLMPNTFSMSQNFPNPFNPSTSIYFSLPRASLVILEVFNVVGQKVTTLAKRRFDAGRHLVMWDGKDWQGVINPSGVYLYRLQAGDFVETRKMLLLK